MNSVVEALRSLSVGQSGHWGVVSANPSAELPTDTAFSKFTDGHRGLVGRFQCTKDGQITNIDLGRTFSVRDLQPELDNLLSVVGAADRNDLARCVFTHFDHLSIDDQCSVLRTTRAVREEQSDGRFQTVVIGSWNLFRIQEHWRKCYQDASPVPDRKQVFFEGPWKIDDVESKLRAAGLISNRPNEYERTCAEMLVEATGGDGFLITYIVDCLSTHQHRLDHLESAIAETIDSGEVAQEFARRCRHLSNNAWDLLARILNSQFVSARDNDMDGEDLRLAGVIGTRWTGAHQVCLSERSAIVDAILRENWHMWAPQQPRVYDGKDLARPNTALNTAAYRLISNIETALRNMLVLSLSVDSAWIERIDQVKTLARDSDGIENELLGLAREILNASTPYIGNAEPNATTTGIASDAPRATEESNIKRPKQIPLVNSAKDWRSRNHSNIALDLAGDSLVYFITTEGLASILVNEKQGIYPDAVKRFFPNKHELTTFLEHYIAIRAAVAHNQPITLGTLRRLQEMKENLEKRMYLSHSSVHVR